MDEKTRLRILALSEGERLDYDRTQTWIDLFLAQVRKNPERTAVVDIQSSYTYGELNRASDSVAAYLLERGVTENSFVAVCMGRVKEYFAVVLGVNKAGAAWVPIDPEYPSERINDMLEDSEARVVVTEETVARALAAHQDAAPICLATPSHRAYMIYTSGSTGKPKGVVIPQRALTNFVHFIARRWGLGVHSRIALHSSFAFDAAVEDLFPALTVGGTVFVVPENVRKDIFEMREYIAEHQINGGSYSTAFGQLLAMDEPLDVDYLCIGGEIMTREPHARGRVYNVYGPTEFTVDATYFELEKGRNYRTIPIGRPLYNCAAYILDTRGHLLPQGVSGELCLAGSQMAEGYWHRPDLTADKFVECPFLPGEKMYRTGDLARYNEEGELEYLGRIDNQVKLRGFRIELGEIENRASLFPYVETAAAEVRREQLVLYYTASTAIDREQLRTFLAQTLADYMVPSVYVPVTEMPLTPSGKLNRKALPDPEFSTMRQPYVPPDNALEKTLCNAFAGALDLEAGSVGIDDDFFTLGGNSIRCMRAVSIAGIERLNISDIYRHRTPARIAEALSETEYKGVTEAQARTMAIPATVGQLSMLDYQFTRAKAVMYNIPVLYRFDTAADAERIETAINAAVRNHPALATVLETDADGRFVQRYRPELLPTAHWEDISPEALHDTVDALVQPFEDYRKPLFRLRLLRCGKIHYMFMDMHHMISDGFSFDVLMEDFDRARRGEPLPEDCYYSYLLGEYRAAQTKEYAEALGYFETLLKGTDWSTIPLPDYTSWEVDRAKEQMNLGLTTADMSAAEKRLGASANVLCLTAGALAMWEYNSCSDIRLCWINENRAQEKYGNTVGLLLKILPVAFHMDEYDSVEALVAEARRQTEAGFIHSVCDYVELVEQALEDSIEINYLTALDSDSECAPSDYWEVELPDRNTAVSERVGLYIFDTDGGLTVLCAYQKRLYAPGSMTAFLRMFKKHLRNVVMGEATE